MTDQDRIPPATETLAATDAPVALADEALDAVSGGLSLTLPSGETVRVFNQPVSKPDRLTEAWKVITDPD